MKRNKTNIKQDKTGISSYKKKMKLRGTKTKTIKLSNGIEYTTTQLK